MDDGLAKIMSYVHIIAKLHLIGAETATTSMFLLKKASAHTNP